MKRVVVLSDLHLGAPSSALDCQPWERPNLGWLRKGLQELGSQRVDYLVLAGDVLDFSVASFQRAYSVAGRFFTALRELDLVEEIIYIPGNHDKDVWDSVQKQVNVFMRLRRSKDLREFPYEQPGIIDNSAHGDGGLNLPGVHYARGRKRRKQYGTLFLEGLFPKDEPLPISVVYPNLYLILPEGCWILVTHGHLFELAWVFVTEVFGGLLKWSSGDPPAGGLKWLEQCNVPANSLICTGLGQGGPSTRLIRRIQAEVKRGKVRQMARVLKAFLRWAYQRLEFAFPLEVAQDLFFDIAVKLIVKEIKKYRPSRGSKTFLKDNRELVRNFLDAMRLTIGSLKAKVIPRHVREYPDCVIFGHTHVPILPQNPQILDIGKSREGPCKIAFLNTGGCLRGEAAAMISIDQKGNCSSWSKDFGFGGK